MLARPDAIRPDHEGCAVADPDTPTVSTVRAVVTDADDPADALTVTFRYTLSTDSSVTGTVTMTHAGDGTFSGRLGPFPYEAVPDDGGVLAVRVSATDPAGAPVTSDPVQVALHSCGPEG